MAKVGNIGNSQNIIMHNPSIASTKHSYSLLGNGSILGSLNRLNKLIIPMLALYALSNIPTANAGPITYGLCFVGCEAAIAAGTLGAATGPGAVLCFQGCLPLLGPWCP